MEERPFLKFFSLSWQVRVQVPRSAPFYLFLSYCSCRAEPLGFMLLHEGGLEKRSTHMPLKHAFAGSNPVSVTILFVFTDFCLCAGLAQLEEQLTRNQQVAGSSPAVGTILVR